MSAASAPALRRRRSCACGAPNLELDGGFVHGHGLRQKSGADGGLLSRRVSRERVLRWFAGPPRGATRLEVEELALHKPQHEAGLAGAHVAEQDLRTEARRFSPSSPSRRQLRRVALPHAAWRNVRRQTDVRPWPRNARGAAAAVKQQRGVGAAGDESRAPCADGARAGRHARRCCNRTHQLGLRRRRGSRGHRRELGEKQASFPWQTLPCDDDGKRPPARGLPERARSTGCAPPAGARTHARGGAPVPGRATLASRSSREGPPGRGSCARSPPELRGQRISAHGARSCERHARR